LEGGERGDGRELIMVSFSQMRFVGIDYSGAQVPTSSLKGLRVYEAIDDGLAVEVLPPPSPRKYWTRKGLVEWLGEILAEGTPKLVGIDHGFSFPEKFFDRYDIPKNWDAFLDDFRAHWPTDEDNVYVSFVRDGLVGLGHKRVGERKWKRTTERRTRGAKSVFHFDVQGQVANSTHAGIPWLRQLRRGLGNRVHFWPFDGWIPSAGSTVIAEVFPSLWRSQYPIEHRTTDQHDAYVVCRWLQDHYRSGEIGRYFQPALTDADRKAAAFEGWILGVS